MGDAGKPKAEHVTPMATRGERKALHVRSGSHKPWDQAAPRGPWCQAQQGTSALV